MFIAPLLLVSRLPGQFINGPGESRPFAIPQVADPAANDRAVSIPRLPLLRVGTTLLGDGSVQARVFENHLYAFREGQCTAYDLTTLRLMWRRQLPGGRYGIRFAFGDKTLFASTSAATETEEGHLYALEPSTGNFRWQMVRQGDESDMEVRGGMLYVSLNPGDVSAIRLSDRRMIWSTSLSTEARHYKGRLSSIVFTSLGSRGRLLAHCSGKLTGLDAKTGQRLWSVDEGNVSAFKTLVTDGVVCQFQNESIEGRQVDTGKLLWSSGLLSAPQFGGVFRHHFVSLQRGILVNTEPTTGKSSPSSDLELERASWDVLEGGSQVAGQLYVRTQSQATMFDRQGKVVWQRPADHAIQPPIWTDGRSLVCFDGNRLFRYVHGGSGPLPKDSAKRRALAARLCAHFAELGVNEIDELAALGDDAFEAVFRLFRRAYIDNARQSGTFIGETVSPESGDYRVLEHVLMQVASRRRMAEVLSVAKKFPDDRRLRSVLVRLATEFGDSKTLVSYFLEVIGATKPNWTSRDADPYAPLDYLKRSPDPRAVAFMIRQLSDSGAPLVVRRAAYENLASTGGDRGAELVIEQRHKRSLLPTIEQRMDLGHVSRSSGDHPVTLLLDERTGADGRTWGLLQSEVLGMYRDLWVAEKVNGVWTRPLFTGVSLELQPGMGVAPEPQMTSYGKTTAQLKAGAWFEAFVRNPELTKGLDGSGLTALEKKRLELSSDSIDSDGDGDADGIDPCPNAPVRALDDAEQVLAAAFESAFHFDLSTAAVVFWAPPDLKPFELLGRQGPVIWRVRRQRTWKFDSSPEPGLDSVEFSIRNDKAKSWSDQLISWNKGHTQAAVTLYSSRGYDLILRKFHGKWVVTGSTKLPEPMY